MKLQKNLGQKGITHLLPIIAVGIILIVGFAVYRVANKNKDDQSQANTQQSQPVQTSDKTEPEKTVYNFENTPLQIDLLDGWEVKINKRYDQTGDDIKESYRGTISGTDGWAISFAIDQGGFGGGPGCNFDNEFPDLPTCPKYEVISKDKLQTGDFLYQLSLAKPGGLEGLDTNCVTVVAENEFNSDEKVGTVFEADGWVCFPHIDIEGSTVENGNPADGRLAIIFPRELNKTTSTAYREESGFKQAMEILGSLRYR